MISHYSILEQQIPGAPASAGHRHSLLALLGRMAFNFKRWLRNCRELRNLDIDQLCDVGLSQETVEQACRLNLLQQ